MSVLLFTTRSRKSIFDLISNKSNSPVKFKNTKPIKNGSITKIVYESGLWESTITINGSSRTTYSLKMGTKIVTHIVEDVDYYKKKTDVIKEEIQQIFNKYEKGIIFI